MSPSPRSLSRRVVLLVAFGVVFGCTASESETDRQRPSASEMPAYEAGSSFRSLSAPLWLAWQSDWSDDPPQVIRLFPADDAESFESGALLVNGQPAAWSVEDGTWRFEYTDGVGRQVTASLPRSGAFDGGADGFDGWAEIERVLDGQRQLGRARVAPLVTELPGSGRLELVAESSEGTGYSVNLAVADDWVAVARGDGGVDLFDVSQRTRGEIPRLSHLAALEGERFNDVEVLRGRWLLVTSSVRGLRIFDALDSRSPRVVVDEFPVGQGQGAHNVFLDGSTAMVARLAPRGGLDVVDVSNPEAPRLGHRFTPEPCDSVHDVRVDAGIAYVNCIDFGLVVLDVSDPGAARELARIEQPGSHSTAWVARGQRLLHLSERFQGRLDLMRQEGEGPRFERTASFRLPVGASVHNATCVGQRCWVSYYQQGLVELVVDDEGQFTVVDSVVTWSEHGAGFFEGTSAAVVKLPWLFVVDTERGLLVFHRHELPNGTSQ